MEKNFNVAVTLLAQRECLPSEEATFKPHRWGVSVYIYIQYSAKCVGRFEEEKNVCIQFIFHQLTKCSE